MNCVAQQAGEGVHIELHSALYYNLLTRVKPGRIDPYMKSYVEAFHLRMFVAAFWPLPDAGELASAACFRGGIVQACEVE